MFLGVMKNKRMHLGHTWSHLGQILDANRVWLTLAQSTQPLNLSLSS